jgi:hypothetical protein
MEKGTGMEKGRISTFVDEIGVMDEIGVSSFFPGRDEIGVSSFFPGTKLVSVHFSGRNWGGKRGHN